MLSGKRARILSGTDLPAGELHRLGQGLAALYTTRLPGGKGINEDSCAVIEFNADSGILAVADGAGGLPSGAKASELTLRAVRQALRLAARSGGDLRGAILDGIERAHHSVQALGVGAGTTLAIAEIRGKRLRSYHVGDSQIIVVGQKGKIKLETMCHSPVGHAVKAGLLTAKAALLHAERHLVSNLIGLPGMSIELSSVVELSQRDTVVLGSDGLFDNLAISEIAEHCRTGQLLGTCGDLIAHCHGRMADGKAGQPSKPDDLTFIAYRRRVTDGD